MLQENQFVLGLQVGFRRSAGDSDGWAFKLSGTIAEDQINLEGNMGSSDDSAEDQALKRTHSGVGSVRGFSRVMFFSDVD